MVSLMQRRREMMLAASAPQSDLLYSLYNETVQTGDTIETGIAVLQQGRSVSIVLDFNQTISNPTTNGANASIYKLLDVTSGGLRVLTIGKYSRSNSTVQIWWYSTANNNYTLVTSSTCSAGRKRFVITHAADSDDITLYSRMATSARQTQTLTKTFVATNSTLRLGVGDTTQTLPGGVINKLEVYNRILTTDEINAVFA